MASVGTNSVFRAAMATRRYRSASAANCVPSAFASARTMRSTEMADRSGGSFARFDLPDVGWLEKSCLINVVIYMIHFRPHASRSRNQDFCFATAFLSAAAFFDAAFLAAAFFGCPQPFVIPSILHEIQNL
jgi:hypothetical protein